jgi:mono/diheme cytochrome c family protein
MQFANVYQLVQQLRNRFHTPTRVFVLRDQSYVAQPLELRLRLAATSLAVCAVLSSASCQPKRVTPAQRGRVIYMSNCVVCHNADPSLPGSQGPEIAGSSRELVEARVLHVSYPPGYTPKRKTNAMRAMTRLAPEIDNLVAFLAAADKQKPVARAIESP